MENKALNALLDTAPQLTIFVVENTKAGENGDLHIIVCTVDSQIEAEKICEGHPHLMWYSTSHFTSEKSYSLETVKDIIFKARTLSSDWLHEYHDLDCEANSPEYNPHFKYQIEELL